MTDETPITIQGPVAKMPIDATGKPPKGPQQINDMRKGIDPAIDYDPGSITGESIAATYGRNALRSVHGNWTAIAEAARDPAISDTDLASTALTVIDKTMKHADEQLARIDQRLKALDQGINQIILGPVDAMLAAEFRSHVKSKKNPREEAHTLVQQDRRAASALLSVPPSLLGFDAETQFWLRDVAIEAHAKELGAEFDETSRVQTKVQTAVKRMAEVLGGRIPYWNKPQSEAFAKLKEKA